MEVGSPVYETFKMDDNQPPIRERLPIREISPPNFSPEPKSDIRLVTPRYPFTRQVIELPVNNLEINDLDTQE
ncbi:hypothetical protein V9T40_008832 [Parthenolecanium corni]|uniref:Uncharacterized protein n=1 Tax=Parthenolecanium corni TaxID=536013 RepID=A0AAN9TNU0_9HEMI